MTCCSHFFVIEWSPNSSTKWFLSCFCMSFCYVAPVFALSSKSFPPLFILQAECLHYHRTSKVLPYARDLDPRSLCRVSTPFVSCRAVHLMGRTGKEGIDFVPDLMWCFGRGGKLRSFLFPPKEWKQKKQCFNCARGLAELWGFGLVFHAETGNPWGHLHL